MIYEEPYITADRMLSIFVSKGNRLADSTIISEFKQNGWETNNYSSAILTLKSEGLIEQEGDKSIYVINGLGTQLSLEGGFKERFVNHVAETQLKKETNKLNREMLISVKETNESVKETNLSNRETNKHVTKNIKQSSNLFWLTFGVAAAGVLFSGLTYFSDTEKRELRQQLKELEHSKQQIQIQRDSLKSVLLRPSLGIDSSKKKDGKKG
jgi:hypothetical protein